MIAPHVTIGPCTLYHGDCLDVLRALPECSVNCCVTSPPYYGLRDYGVDGQLGLEKTPAEYVEKMVNVFREVRRVLRDDGTLWLNLGDSYAAGGNGGGNKNDTNIGSLTVGPKKPPAGYKPKDILGIPWRVAFALQADGWYLRQDIIWHKPNPMPESVQDRCTKAHEYLFLLAKSERYYFDAGAIREPNSPNSTKWGKMVPTKTAKAQGEHGATSALTSSMSRQDCIDKYYTNGRNRRSVWTITPKPFKGAHFAVMPPALVEPCILAGCPEGGTVLEPFAGSGTVLAVAKELGRKAIGIELNPEYIAIAESRVNKSAPKRELIPA